MPGRVVADGVDVRGRDLDQALVERTLREVVGAHPGGLERLVGGEEVAPVVGGEPRLERGASSLRRERTPRLVAIALADDALARSRRRDGHRPECSRPVLDRRPEPGLKATRRAAA